MKIGKKEPVGNQPAHVWKSAVDGSGRQKIQVGIVEINDNDVGLTVCPKANPWNAQDEQTQKEKTAHEARPSLIAKHSAPQLANHGS
jgi:hypothetical protein